VIPDAAARVEAVLTGAADAAEHLPLTEVDRLARHPDVRAIVREGMRVIFLALRPQGAPFQDPRVREAVDLAIDRAELVRIALHGHGTPASQLVPPALPGYNPELAVGKPDPARARALLAQAGHAAGLEVELVGPNNRYLNDGVVLAEVARQLAEVGVHARVNALDKGVFFPLVSSGRTRFHLMGWSSEAADAGDALDALAHSKDETGMGAENDVDLSDPQLDALILSANSATQGGERLADLRRAMARLMALRVYLPLYVQPESVLVSRRLYWDPSPSLAFVPAEMRRLPPA
jgi:peptide/nickel transport system substrate-binding protein